MALDRNDPHLFARRLIVFFVAHVEIIIICHRPIITRPFTTPCGFVSKWPSNQCSTAASLVSSSRVLQPHVTAHEMLSDCGHAHASAGAYRAGCRCYNAALFQTRFYIHCTSRSATLLSVAQLQPTFTFTAAPHWHRRLWSRYLDDLCGDLAGKKIAIKTCPPRQVTA